MARVTYGGLITDLSGSIGGLTFQNNPSGSICRLKPIKKKTTTLKQNVRIIDFSTMISSWYCLNLAHKLNWQIYANTYQKYDAWGRLKTLSGYNWYLSINGILDLISAVNVSNPPTHTLPDPCPNYYILSSLSDLIVIFNPEITISGHSLLIYTTPPISNYTTGFKKDLRLTSVNNTGVFNTFSIKSDWEVAHSLSYPVGSGTYNYTIGFMIRIVRNDSGLASVGSLYITDVISSIKGIGRMAVGSSFIVA